MLTSRSRTRDIGIRKSAINSYIKDQFSYPMLNLSRYNTTENIQINVVHSVYTTTYTIIDSSSQAYPAEDDMKT